MVSDRGAGDLWLGDVGRRIGEEIDVVRQEGNYGWRTVEGPRCVGSGAVPGGSAAHRPGLQYSHKGRRRRSWRYVYRGKGRCPGSRGATCSDYVTGKIWALTNEPDHRASSPSSSPRGPRRSRLRSEGFDGRSTPCRPAPASR
ncbi:MAG: PQQ-dependent sugar dehydrogenase [Myxococcales bacterium]|nr:PQQ-dependent sugar dehydrogenase [Myxococcales bacterium]